jgi:hypothetical protein
MYGEYVVEFVDEHARRDRYADRPNRDGDYVIPRIIYSDACKTAMRPTPT